MILNIKNTKIEELWVEHKRASDQMDEERQGGGPDKISKESMAWIGKHPEHILYGYLKSFVEHGISDDFPLDLTYGTVKNLTKDICLMYLFQKKNGYMDRENLSCMGKTLAAYLMLLAMNEHGYGYRTRQCGDGRPNGTEFLWADAHKIMTGPKKNVDLLPCCMKAVQRGSVTLESGITVQIDGVVSDYQKMTGVNLRDYGFHNTLMHC